MTIDDLKITTHTFTKDNVRYAREFDWVQLQVADVHFEHSVIKEYIDLNLVPFIHTFAEELDFVSEAQQSYVKTCKDHHLSWELFTIFHKAAIQEFVLPYASDCLHAGRKPTACEFLAYRDKAMGSPAYIYIYIYIYEQVCLYGQAICV